jgi:putative hydrolase of the HAD superfamily
MLLNWDSFELMVFDVDGTLYDQKKLRRRMAGALLRHTVVTGGVDTVMILRSYRKWREELAEQEVHQFEDILTNRLAVRYGRSKAQIEALVSAWMELKPLPYLKRYRRPGLKELFARLREAGKTIAVLSDYPAQDKLARLELDADIVVSARDPDVDVLKPHPRGIQQVMQIAGVAPEATVMIGDRAERDGEMARRAGVRALVLSQKPIPGWTCFQSFHEFLGAKANASDRFECA